VNPFGKRRRRKLAETPWPETWRAYARKHAPLYGLLPDTEREHLEAAVQIFLAEKSFEGCAGLSVSDEIRVAIASLACVLQLRPSADLYPKLDTILVYPEPFVVDQVVEHDTGLVTESREEFLGESWDTGALVLSWSDVRRDAAAFGEGYSVVLHEFAHQLDEENPAAEGTPLLPDAALASDWARVLGRAYKDMCATVDRGEETYLDPYAAESPAEFFAVVTEEFFTAATDFRTADPELYAVLARYYSLDPAAWHGEL
jgi:Mlc titration factor MtfA (ptsG expression regulator)